MNIRADYEKVWQQLIDSHNAFLRQLSEGVSSGQVGSLHQALLEMYRIPYQKAHALMQPFALENIPENIGTVTGLFFELAVASLLVPFFRAQCLGSTIEINRCSASARLDVPRDPDIFVTRGGKAVAFEAKVSPKLMDIEPVLRKKARFEKAKISYYLIGGHVSLNQSSLKELCDGGWACFLEGSPRNKNLIAAFPTLDLILQKALKSLGNT
jgi:hypothetical protein